MAKAPIAFGELTKGHNYVKASNRLFLVLHLQEEFMNDLD